jgi:UPF0755 protein
LLARLKGQAGEIKAGSYALEKPATPLQLLRKITEGDTVLGKLALIEGWSFRDMRRSVAAIRPCATTRRDMSDAELLQAIGARESHPEGLFYPDTYFFDQGSSELALYKRAYHAMQENLQASWAMRSNGCHIACPIVLPYEVLIMASIIEKETGAAEERPLIASVFLNRLRIGMRLQTDPTVIYGLGERFDGNLRRDDLLTDTPYNTYTRAGLPPTPIALPGLALRSRRRCTRNRARRCTSSPKATAAMSFPKRWTPTTARLPATREVAEHVHHAGRRRWRRQEQSSDLAGRLVQGARPSRCA